MDITQYHRKSIISFVLLSTIIWTQVTACVQATPESIPTITPSLVPSPTPTLTPLPYFTMQIFPDQVRQTTKANDQIGSGRSRSTIPPELGNDDGPHVRHQFISVNRSRKVAMEMNNAARRRNDPSIRGNRYGGRNAPWSIRSPSHHQTTGVARRINTPWEIGE